jgi:hypothetical protein
MVAMILMVEEEDWMMIGHWHRMLLLSFRYCYLRATMGEAMERY